MKPTGPLEKIIEGKVVDYAKSKGCLCYKFTSPSRRSVPDRLFITPKGECFFIELKRKGQKPTAAQEVEIDKIRRQGVPVWVVDDAEEGKTIIRLFIEGKMENAFTKEPPTFCSVCGSPQFKTPSGLTCENGHGGAPARKVFTQDDF